MSKKPASRAPSRKTAGGSKTAIDRTKLPLPASKFEGKINEYYTNSKPDWPKLPTPPKGAPNVVIIVLDDVGFGQVGTFGGPVPTPALDRLAAPG